MDVDERTGLWLGYAERLLDRRKVQSNWRRADGGQ